jgi:hypothetical protein
MVADDYIVPASECGAQKEPSEFVGRLDRRIPKPCEEETPSDAAASGSGFVQRVFFPT